MTASPEAPEAPARPRRRWKLKLVAAGLIVAPLLLFSLYVVLTLSWSYSDGRRAGVLQKFSRKGWICKTHEGELAMSIVPGVAPTIWEFSVRDPAVIPKLNQALGRRVALHYTEHHGVPTQCFGMTNYYVDSVVAVE
jgi:hypothetical protein